MGLSPAFGSRPLVLGSRIVLAVTLLAVGPAWRTVSRPDVNLFGQPACDLERLRLLHQMREDFGGDILAAVVSIPDNPSPQQVKELRAFALLLAGALAQAGALPEDRANLSLALQQELPPDSPWLRQVECRTGQGIEQAVRKIIKDRPYVVLTPGDVEVLKKLFEPQAIASALDRVAATINTLPPGSAEAARLQEDPLGIAEIARDTLRQRLAQRREALAGNDPEGFFLSPDRTTLVVHGRAVLPATRQDFNEELLNAAQRAANRALAEFRKSNPSLTTALEGQEFSQDEATKTEQLGALHVGFTGLPAESPAGTQYNLIFIASACLAGGFILALVSSRSLSAAWHVTWAAAAVVIWTLAIAGIDRGAIGLLCGTLACLLVGAAAGCAIQIHNAQQILEKRRARIAGLAAGVMAFAGAVVFIRYGLYPGLETAAGRACQPESGTSRSAATSAVLLRNRLAERFGSGLAELRVLVAAPDEEHAYAGAEEAARRLQPFVERGELLRPPGGSILDFVPSARQQQETIAALKTFDFTAAGKTFKAAALERFGSRAGHFEPFLEWLRKYSALTREPAPLTLAAVMPTPLGNLLAPYVKLDPGEVRLASFWSLSPRAFAQAKRTTDMPAQWYDGIARELEKDTPQGVVIRVTAARLADLEIRHSLISLGIAALFGYIGALSGALVVLPVLRRSCCRREAQRHGETG